MSGVTGRSVYLTGLSGRPTAIANLILPEARRRIASQNAEPLPKTQHEFAGQLSKWLKDAHPQAPPATPKAIENNEEFSALWRSRSKPVPK
jgi:hypothetical protein